MSYLEDRPDMSPEEKQNALTQASSDFVEPAAAQDSISYEMDRVLDLLAPREPGPEPD